MLGVRASTRDLGETQFSPWQQPVNSDEPSSWLISTWVTRVIFIFIRSSILSTYYVAGIVPAPSGTVMTRLVRPEHAYGFCPCKKQRHYFAHKGPYSQSYGFSSSHAWMWESNQKESWAPKHWCFWTVVLEKTLESPLDCKEIKPVNPKGNQPWIFIGRTDAKAETPILWPLMQRANSLEKPLMLWKIEDRRRRQ